MFDGRALRAVREFVHGAEEEVATRLGVRLVREELRRDVKHWTGRYAATIRVGRRGGHFVVHDGRQLPYGLWLAGRGSRNYPVTRFKGYRHWERATERIQAGAVPTATALLRRRFLRRMN